MAQVQVILHGMPSGSVHDTDNYPVILQFDESKTYANAVWIVPSFPGAIPANALSEIRVEQGPLTVVVEGPKGFQSGPHDADWVRSDYPRGKLCSFLQMDASTQKMGGVSIQVVEGSLIVDPVAVGGAKPAEAPKTEDAKPEDEA
ncbi:MAG TPA: hypothetical protein VI759_06785 [Dehalococcoidia bacterium]|nr:hypothetical protein [Dehalococcoidia bacterium]